MKITIFLALFILLVPIAYAACPGNHTAAGGNVTPINITMIRTAGDWQGYAGIITYGTGATAPTTVNATGSNVSGEGLHFQIPCNNPTSITGFVLFSNSSSAPVGLVPGNLTQLDAFVPGLENGTLTFTQTSIFNFPSAGVVAGVPTTHTYVNSGPQSTNFREGYFNDAAGNIVFATEINFVPPPGYNTSRFSYQALLAAPNYSTVPYYLFTDLNATCPGPTPPSGGGGGGGGYYPETWNCGNWTICIDNIQRRNCTQTVYNKYSSGYFPPTERICGTPGFKQQEITIEDARFEQIYDQTTMVVNKLDVTALWPNTFMISMRNDNDFSLENLRITLDLPEIMSKLLPIHQYTNVLWKSQWLTGWSLRPFRARSYPWRLDLPTGFRISPQSSSVPEMTITPPAMIPQEVNAALTLWMGEKTIETINVPINVRVNEFDVGYSYDAEREIFALFFIVDNRGKPAKESAFIEFNIGIKLAEYYGPYDFPADEVTILAQEYNLKPLNKEYELKAVFYDDTKYNEVRKQCIISE